MNNLFTEEEMMTNVMAATGTTSLFIIRKLEENGMVTHEYATDYRKLTLERFGDDIMKSFKIYNEHHIKQQIPENILTEIISIVKKKKRNIALWITGTIIASIISAIIGHLI
jgi:Mn-dependent DtxR family transcriptional regulator